MPNLDPTPDLPVTKDADDSVTHIEFNQIKDAIANLALALGAVDDGSVTTVATSLTDRLLLAGGILTGDVTLDAGVKLLVENAQGGNLMRVTGVNTSGRQVLSLEDPTSATGVYVLGPSDGTAASTVRVYTGSTNRLEIDSAGLEINGQDVWNGPRLVDVFDKHSTNNGGSSGTIGLGWNVAPSIYYYLTGTTTFTFTWPTIGTDERYTVALSLYFGSVPSITWPAEVKWIGGSAPTFEANKFNEIVFSKWSYNGSDYPTKGVYLGAWS